MNVLIDKEKWSESSKRSFAYSGSLKTHYEDISYRCTKCSQVAMFTAAEQKNAYEVLRQFIWRQRTLCPKCYSNLELLRKKDRQFEKEWAENKARLKSDRQFLWAWLEVLEDIPTYGKRPHSSMIVMLQKLSYQCI